MKKKPDLTPTELPDDESPIEPTVEMVDVRALMDDATQGLKAGFVGRVAAHLVAALKAQGAIDDHPEAVAAAMDQGE